jgi:hypothetical protein
MSDKIPRISIDANIDNADWTKQTWDFPFMRSVDDLRRWLHESGRTVEGFKQMPVYKHAIRKGYPPWLREL